MIQPGLWYAARSPFVLISSLFRVLNIIWRCSIASRNNGLEILLQKYVIAWFSGSFLYTQRARWCLLIRCLLLFAKLLLHQLIPLICRLLFLRVYNNENGACHTSAWNIGSTSTMHIKSRRQNAVTLSIYCERCKTRTHHWHSGRMIIYRLLWSIPCMVPHVSKYRCTDWWCSTNAVL